MDGKFTGLGGKYMSFHTNDIADIEEFFVGRSKPVLFAGDVA